MAELTQLDRAAVRKAFGRAAESYDDAAVLQREVANRMLERLDYIMATPKRILDLGAGTGEHTAQLARRYKGAQVIGLDLAEPMLKQLRRRSSWRRPLRPVCADIQSLPFADNSIDLIFSSLAVQWCSSLDEAFSEFKRVLRPGGFVLFSTFGPDTLKELRSSWSEVDNHVHVNDFIDMHDIGDAMLRSQLAQPVMDVETFTLTYPNIFSLMRELKDIGAHNVAGERVRGLTSRARMQALQAAYEKWRHDGVLPASYEVVYGHCWAPDETATQQAVSIDSLRDINR